MMAPKALIFGGIGSIAECADLDRAAWNAAFRRHGVAWDWSRDVYAELMRPGGNRQLAARYADRLALDVDADQLDRTHQTVFAGRLADGIPLRPGVIDVLTWAAKRGLPLALVSRSEADPVRALLKATARARAGIAFDLIVLRDDVEQMAPEPDAMTLALQSLHLHPEETLAIVDTPVTALAAEAAGLSTLAVPGQLVDREDFHANQIVVEKLSISAVMAAWCGAPMEAAE